MFVYIYISIMYIYIYTCIYLHTHRKRVYIKSNSILSISSPIPILSPQNKLIKSLFLGYSLFSSWSHPPTQFPTLEILLTMSPLVCPRSSWLPGLWWGGQRISASLCSWDHLLPSNWFFCCWSLYMPFDTPHCCQNYPSEKPSVEFCHFALKPLWLHFAYKINFNLL